MEPLVVGALTIEVIRGSITELAEHFDALVSSDDNYLSHGGGVSRALWRAAGPKLERHLASHAPLRLGLGDVLVTPAFDLRAKSLFHAVTIDFDAHRRLGVQEAAALYGAVIDEAAARGLRSVALPLLGGGVGGLGSRSSAVAFAEAVDAGAAVPSSVDRVALVVVDEAAVVESTLQDRLKARPSMDRLVEAARRRDRAGPRVAAAWDEVRRRREKAGPAVHLLEATLQLLVDASLEEARKSSHPAELAADPRLVLQDDGTLTLRDEPRTLGDLLATVQALRGLARRVLDRATVDLARRALEARNQLAHGVTVELAGTKTVLRGVEALLVDLVGFVSAPAIEPTRFASTAVFSSPPEITHRIMSAGPFGIIGAALGPLAAGIAAAGVTGVVGPGSPAAKGASPSLASLPREGNHPSGTAHVRRLAHFLQEHLDRADLEELHLELERDHYVGSNEVRLLEHCVSMADPVDFLTSRFTRSQLQRHLRSQSGIEVGAADHRQCAEKLLAAFGFPSAAALRGPRQILHALRIGRAEIASSDLVRLRGAVTGASSQLEYLVIVLLRFLCLAAFREAPEPHFRNRGKLEASRAVDGCPLGKLLELLELLGRELQTDDSPTVTAFQHDFNTRSLAPEGGLRVTQLRNRFAHFDRTSAPMDLASARRAAVEFFDEAIAFVEHLLAEPRIFPRIVRVERIVHDRWGRKTVHALDDEGIQETIFSDHPLQPGRAYYMHPISNPLRVDPILVDAGDGIG